MSVQPPDEELHDKEIVGRRAFGRCKKIFHENNTVLHYRLDVFIDKRPGGISVDRLGIGDYDKKRLGFLDTLGVAMGEKRTVRFRGWAQFSVSDLRECIQPTEAVGEENPFHAEVMRDGFPSPEAKRALAYQMCVLASQRDCIPSLTNGAEAA